MSALLHDRDSVYYPTEDDVPETLLHALIRTMLFTIVRR